MLGIILNEGIELGVYDGSDDKLGCDDGILLGTHVQQASYAVITSPLSIEPTRSQYVSGSVATVEQPIAGLSFQSHPDKSVQTDGICVTEGLNEGDTD